MFWGIGICITLTRHRERRVTCQSPQDWQLLRCQIGSRTGDRGIGQLSRVRPGMFHFNSLTVRAISLTYSDVYFIKSTQKLSLCWRVTKQIYVSWQFCFVHTPQVQRKQPWHLYWHFFPRRLQLKWWENTTYFCETDVADDKHSYTCFFSSCSCSTSSPQPWSKMCNTIAKQTLCWNCKK